MNALGSADEDDLVDSGQKYDAFKLPPINKVSYGDQGNTNQYYRKDRAKMARNIAKGEVEIEKSPDMNIRDE